MTLSGHQDIVTGLRLSPDGNSLLSNSMDNTMRSWDVKPYAAGDRCEKVFLGAQVPSPPPPPPAPPRCFSRRRRRPPDRPLPVPDPHPLGRPAQHNYEKGLLKCSWSKNASQVAAGSADNFVYVWNAETKRILYKLPGHKGTVNEVDFHPTQPIISRAATTSKFISARSARRELACSSVVAPSRPRAPLPGCRAGQHGVSVDRLQPARERRVDGCSGWRPSMYGGRPTRAGTRPRAARLRLRLRHGPRLAPTEVGSR